MNRIIRTAHGKTIFDESQSSTIVVSELAQGKHYVIIPCKARYLVKRILTERTIFEEQEIYIV